MPLNHQRHFILWTLIAVILGGVGVFASVIQAPDSVRRQAPQASSASLVETTDRSPASEAPEFSARALDEKGTQAVDFTVPCEGDSNFAKNIVQVRLSGKLCGPNAKKEITSSEITNTTNGFSATVFPTKLNSFTTDYMTLAPGDNHIHMLHTLASGVKVQRDLTIHRQ